MPGRRRRARPEADRRHAPGHRLRRPQLRRRRPRRGRAARRGPARRLRHLGAQDLRPCQQRDDLLRPRARPRRGPRRHHRAAGVVRATRRSGALKPGDDAISLLGLDDEVVEVTVTPDRGYCFSLRGIAREYGHATGAPSATRRPSPVDRRRAPRLPGRGRRRRAAAGPRGLRPLRRPGRPRRRRRPGPRRTGCRSASRQSGMRPISLAVDVTNYVMLALGQPLHAFDVVAASAARSSSAGRARASSSRRWTTSERTLLPEDLLITDGGQAPLAIAGVMGGAATEVTAATTDILRRVRALRPDRRSPGPRAGTSWSPRRPSATSVASTPTWPPLPPSWP